MLKMQELDLEDKRVIIREDLNVPLDEHGLITNDTRIRAALPTIKQALEMGARVIIFSHLGRPEEGIFDEQYSLAPVATRLSELLDMPVDLINDWSGGVDIGPGEVALCENVRFIKGEKENDEVTARLMAALGDVFVMDAFATAHRAHASTHGTACFAKLACAGPLLTAEIEALDKILSSPTRPMLAIVGGSKVSTKLSLLDKLSEKVDQLIVGGGIANTFLAAKGYDIGKSLCEPELIPLAKAILEKTHIPLPEDVIVAKTFSEDAVAETKSIDYIDADDMILDIGPATAAQYGKYIRDAKTILWNGPVGVFEFPAFASGTAALTEAIAASDAYSVAGGGDTLVAIEQFGVSDKVSYISTGGGAFLAYVEGKPLPAIEVLQQRANEIN